MKLASPPEAAEAAPESAGAPLPPCPLEAEERFFGEYDWCLNPCLTVGQAAQRLAEELGRLDAVAEGWQRLEVMTNAYLLACALLNAADDYLRGPVYQLPRRAALLPFSRLALRTVERVIAWRRARGIRRVAAWRDRAAAALDAFLQVYVTSISAGAAPPPNPPPASGEGRVGEAGKALAEAARAPLPADLQAEIVQIPSAFRKQDLAPSDVLTLGRRFAERFPERQESILVVGLRTAGSYFAPLFRALLETEGYRNVESMTIRPGRGLSARERSALQARAGGRPVLLDDPPFSGDTMAHAADLLRRAGFAADRLAVLFPVHPLRRHWSGHLESVSLAHLLTLSLEPEQWHKTHLLEPAVVESRLTEYFRRRGYESVRVVAGPAAEAFNARLESTCEEKRRNRLKRVYEVRLQTADGGGETRFVLAKSVGWGYLSYHAFLCASRLAGFVPPLLGLRDGLLYTEWVPQPATVPAEGVRREAWIERIGAYVAARANRLRLPEDPTPSLGLNKQHDAFELLEKVLSKAYGGPALSGLMRGRVRRRLAAHGCPTPTLIDAKMRPAEWLTQDGVLLKTDFEHHGIGKNELNVVDPAYDLAEAALHLGLSPDEEGRLLRRYREESGDESVEDRLFLHKLLAGLRAMTEATRNIEQHDLSHRQREYHNDYVRAWDYLTVQSARRCGRLCGAPPPLGRGLQTTPQPASALGRGLQTTPQPGWASPLVVLDVDGVLDRRLFGFPCTSLAGVRSLALLHAHGRAVALNTARSAREVKEYCAAYGCAGAVAEYGSYVWDAVGQRGRSLVAAGPLRQLDRARTALARLPGVFVNDGYEHSIRACTYEDGAPVPLPTLMIHRLLAEHGLDELAWHQTTIDTTVTARDVNKGTGLLALLDWVGLADAETLAVGDSEPDLAMFRAARRGFAPSNISCGRLARFLGCSIAPEPYQRGLLHIVRSLLHPDGGRCDRCAAGDRLWAPGEDLFLDLLAAADDKRLRRLARVVLHPAAFTVFAG